MTRESTRSWLVQYAAMGFDPLDADKWLIMQAYSEGADIEWSCKGENVWHPASDPAWQWGVCDYRIKPTQVRPYTLEEFAHYISSHLDTAHTLISKVGGGRFYINSIDFFTGSDQVVELHNHWYTLDALATLFTWEDGTPCGVKL